MGELTARVAEDRGRSAILEALDGDTVVGSAEVVKGGPDWVPYARWTGQLLGGTVEIGWQRPED